MWIDGRQSLPNLAWGTKAHYESLSQWEIDEYVEQLTTHKLAKGTGAQVSTKSKLMDIQHTTGHVQREVSYGQNIHVSVTNVLMGL